MATTVYETLELTLLNGVEVEIKPLSLKGQRKATRLLSEFSEGVEGGKYKDVDSNDFNDIFVDILVEVAILALSKKHPELALDRELLLDILDMKTLTEIVRVAANWDFDAEVPKELASPLVGVS